MSYKSLTSVLRIPKFDLAITGSFFSTVSVDFAFANRYASMIFAIPKTGSITKLGFYNGASGGITGTAEASIQTVSSGIPSGSDYGGSAPGTVSNPAASTAYEITLGTPASATKGDRVALKLRLTAISSGVLRPQFLTQSPNYQLPYMVNNFDAKSSCIPSMWIVYSDGTVGNIPGTFPLITSTTLAVSSSTTPDEVGNYFTSPIKLRVVGVAAMFPSTNGPTSADSLKIYDSSNTVLGTMTFDVGTIAISGAFGFSHVLFSSTIDIEADTVYRIAFLPGATSRDIKYFTYPSQNLMINGWDSAWKYTSRVDAGAWTETDGRALPFTLLVDAIDIPTAGGLLTHPGMAGGLRG